jgi:hypothetical protein
VHVEIEGNGGEDEKPTVGSTEAVQDQKDSERTRKLAELMNSKFNSSLYLITFP